MTQTRGKDLVALMLIAITLLGVDTIPAQETNTQETSDPAQGTDELATDAAPPEQDQGERQTTPQESSETEAGSTRAKQPEPEPLAPAEAVAEELDTIPLPPEPSPAIPDAGESPVLDPVIVTAQKREQVIQDVPVSISVFSNDFITRQGITSLTDIARYAPNVGLGEAGFVIRPRIRGFSNNFDNPGFEPPVAVAIDDVPYTRTPYFQAAVYDVSRVEVLRGPQGTSFGKNTTAGLFSIVTKDPTAEFQGAVDLQSGELGRQRAEFGLGGPLFGDFIEFRIAGLSDEQDGFTQNTFAQTDPNATREFRGRKREGGRAKLRFTDLLGSNLKLTYEHIQLDSDGTGAEIFNFTDDLQDYVRQTDPNADFVADNYINSIGGRDFRTSTIESYGARWDLRFGTWGFALIGARSQMDTFGKGDSDFTPVEALDVVFQEHTPTTTFELRALAPRFDGLLGVDDVLGIDFGATELLAGVFYQRQEISPNVLELLVNDDGVLGLLFSESGSSPPSTGGVKERGRTTFSQDAETMAGFAQLDWYLREQWALQLGARLNTEVKQGSWERVVVSASNAVLTAADFRPYTAEREISETQIQPKISLNYKPFDALSVFLNWTRGFKSGGFNAVAENPTDEELLFRAEKATQWAIDAKTFIDTVQFNLSLYHLTLEDFQVLTSERKGPPGNENLVNVTKVTNAKEALAQGAEADLIWQPVRWWRVAAGLGYNDTEYIDFPIGPCPPGRTNTDGDADPRCDLSGRPFPFAPKWNGMLTSGLALPFWKDLEFGVDLTVDYNSFHYVRENLDSRMAQDAYYRLKASVGIGDPSKGWTFRVTGDNLTDEVIAIERGIAAPTSQGLVSVTGQPRVIFGQLHWKF